MTAKLTKSEFVKFLNGTIGKQYDYDGWYGFQCFDYANIGWQQLFGHGLKGNGAIDIPTHNNFDNEATVYENTKSFKAEPGDMVVFNANYGQGYGHVAWVISATLNEITVLEQNWLGYGWTDGIERGGKGWETVTKRTHAYDFPMWFIRPKFKAETKKTESTKKENTNKKKGKTLKYNRDEVTGYKLPKRGYKPKGVVIHNDAGSLSAMQYHDSLVNAPLSRLENGIAHSYISGNTVWQALPEGRIAWHTGDNYGNTNYYGIEGCRSMSASDKEFMETEQSTFQETARMLKKWGKPVNYETVKLHMEFVPTACPHRSMKLHTGWDPVKQGRPNQATINKLKDYFISQIEQYYDGKIPKGTTVTASKPSANTTAKTPSGWKKNKYGILWKKEKGTFTCKAKDGIVTRYKGPSIHNPIAGGLEYNQSVNYDEIQDYEGYIWISWEVYSGATVYMPIGKSNGKGQRVGSAWGTFK
ncbi:SH3 domain-containing protein [Mammaliicoccus sciuri]|uniref:SH3 domain-containing protein n=2 Tax=Mammaliicoccus TaxID=2803850 RepID=UPI001FB24D75|nr:SH3 domain-containing protein [Mammaliicoccus sciuri]MCJ0918723.1 SH3 domain-containing protein [Mammaliicoccus sciuri]MCJ0961257.1 SH3 domain-containing protein [Mammaliicoccus sciuri]